jgi:hypothetical protein
MSNEMSLVGAIFHMRRGQEKAAKAALREAASVALEKKDMRAGDIQEMIDGAPEGGIEQLTLDQLIRCWGWSLLRDRDHEKGKIVGITLLEDFSSDEEALFEVLGPFVVAGSHIDLEGKRFDGYWQTRFAFTGQQVVAMEPTFPPAPRIEEALPSTWEALQHPPSDVMWKKVNADPFRVGSLTDQVDKAATALARQLKIKPAQALFILMETCFQRLK